MHKLEEIARACESGPPCLELDLAISRFVPGATVEFYSPLHWLLPRWTSDLNAAFSLNKHNWLLITLSDIAGDGLPFVKLGNPATTPTKEVCAVAVGKGTTLAGIVCAALLRAMVEEEASRG